jgi:two-component system OmpR family sensor kinase
MSRKRAVHALRTARIARRTRSRMLARLTGRPNRTLCSAASSPSMVASLASGQPRGDDYFSFADVVQRVVQDARYEAAAKKIAVLLAVTPPAEDLEWLVMGNGKLVSRAVENIVRNALRYSPDGGTVALTLQQDAELYRLSVTDEGPGVPPDAMTSLFKPFGLSADGFGFGLGLAIAQRAVAVHGGTISVANRPSQGLEMTLTLPASALENRLENRPENRPENRKA